MEKRFSIRQAAALTGMTSETLRHYDRIGLVRPAFRDEWSGYRYYSREDIVRLNTVQLLRRMDLSLKEIGETLALDDLDKVVAALDRAERNADEKIVRLQYAKEKIQRAKADYQQKRRGQARQAGPFVRHFPERAILLSKSLEQPTLDNLWSYHRHFYGQTAAELQAQFAFADLAGIYTGEGKDRLFALCLRHPAEAEGLRILPEGDYLCADCREEERETLLDRLWADACGRTGQTPAFGLQVVVISGILQWNYQLQVPLCPGEQERDKEEKHT